MNALYPYIPFIGMLFIILGMVRILIRSDVDFGRGPTDMRGKQHDDADQAAVWIALWSSASRFDLGLMALGIAVLAIFIFSIS